MQKYLQYSNEVSQAKRLELPIVALETAVVTHGLPRPQNLTLARELEAVVRENDAVPATIAVLDGKIRIGLTSEQLDQLSAAENTRKISRRDFAIALEHNEAGGTTVAGTLFAAHAAGIQVFATGGIGGVHREAPFDVSADLPELSRTPVIVICAGAKAILDLPNTLEYLETAGVPVIGYQTDHFPAFYSTSSGLPINVRMDDPKDIASLAKTHWALGLNTAVLVVQPPPSELALPYEKVEEAIQRAVFEAHEAGVRGQQMTPFLLSRVTELTAGASMRVNLALLRNNALLAARIARALHPRRMV